MRSSVAVVIFLYSVSVASVSWRDSRGNQSENHIQRQTFTQLKLERNHYFTNQVIDIEFIVTNLGDEVITLFPASKVIETWQLVVKDENDTVIPMLDNPDGMGERTSRKVVNFAGDEVKEIILHKNESFIKKVNLGNFYQLQPGKKYYISGYFYPNKLESKDYFLRTKNTVSFLLEKHRHEKVIPSFTEYYAQKGVAPEEVVHLFLGAEKNANWRNYFKWLQLEEFILAYDRFAVVYSNAEDDEKYLILEEFKKYLTETRSGKLVYYKILGEKQLSDQIAEVSVMVERNTGKIKNKFEYTYTLKSSQGNDWKIANVVVKVKK